MAARVDSSVLLRSLEKADHPLGVAELLRASGLHGGQRSEVKRTMRALVREGRVEQAGQGFSLAGRRAAAKDGHRPGPGARGRKVLEGTLTVHRDGFGFVDVGAEEDIFVPPHEARRALDGDRVKVEVVSARGRSVVRTRRWSGPAILPSRVRSAFRGRSSPATATW
jgi:ribonuclease R